MNEVGCKKCSSPDCRGCNMFILFKALRSGVFTPVMNKTMSIDIDTLKEKLAERKTGKWVHLPNLWGVVFCSECNYDLRINDTKYCPNCGAKMEVDE